MEKAAFKIFVRNVGHMSAEALLEFKKVPVQDKVHFLVEFLDEYDEPKFRLISALLLRTLLMEDFDSAWMTMDRKKQLKFMEKVKLILIDIHESSAMCQVAVHLAAMIINSNKLEERILISFLHFINTVVISSDVKQQKNGALLCYLITPIIINERKFLEILISGFYEIVSGKNTDYKLKQIALDCTTFIVLLLVFDAYTSIADDLLYKRISLLVFSVLGDLKFFEDVLHWFDEDTGHYQFIDSANISLYDQACVQYAIIKTGLPKLDLLQMTLHSKMHIREKDRKPAVLYRKYFMLTALNIMPEGDLRILFTSAIFLCNVHDPGMNC